MTHTPPATHVIQIRSTDRQYKKFVFCELRDERQGWADQARNLARNLWSQAPMGAGSVTFEARVVARDPSAFSFSKIKSDVTWTKLRAL